MTAVSGPIVYLDTSGVREGALEKLRVAIDELAIHVYGGPSERALGRLRAKARDLGSGKVTVHPPRAGFSRLQPIAKLD